MKNRYRGQVALALFACLPFSQAWAASVADTANVPLERLRSGGTTTLATASGISPKGSPALPTDDAAVAPFADTQPLTPMDWDLAEASATGWPVMVTANVPSEKPSMMAISLPDDSDPYGPAVETTSEASPSPGAGPPVPLDRSGHVPREFASHRGFFRQAGSAGTEIALLSGYVLAQGIPKLFKPTTRFHFKDEGWFGKNTHNVGMDKLTHAFNTYLIAEILHHRIHRNTGGSAGDALTAGILASGLMALNEISDAVEPDSGYSVEDIAFNVAGATFSVLRNRIPGLKEKLAFKIEILPNRQIYSRAGKRHYEQQRFMFSLKGTGFEKLQNSKLKYLDLQVGYYASDFLSSDREQGITPKRHLFVGVGLNVGELLFGKSQSRLGKAARSVLDYIQLPYTSLRYDTTGRFGN